MKIGQLISILKGMAAREVDPQKTCDTLKIGNAEEEIRGVAVTMFATPRVIRAAAEKGCNFIIVHEPLCYDHLDQKIPLSIGHEKKQLLEQLGMSVFRFHDYAHSMAPDLIFDGMMKSIALSGKRMERPQYAINRMALNTPLTAIELAEHLEKTLGIAHIQIAGERNKKGTLVSCAFGTPGHLRVMEEIEVCDFVLTGELCQWREAEAVRDWAELGYNKAVLVMGHIGSERDGMKLLSEKLSADFPEFPTYYSRGELNPHRF